MSFDIGNLCGAITSVTTASSGPKSLKSFLNSIDSLGVQTTNNFEVNFSGIPDLCFYFQSITIPGMNINTTEIAYNGQKVEIPVNYDYQHDFSATVINDGSGYIYSAIANFVISNMSTPKANSGYTMTIKAMTGDKKYKGTVYTLNGVRLVGIGSIDYNHSSSDVSTFSLSFKCANYTVTAGALGKVSGIMGAVNSLIG